MPSAMISVMTTSPIAPCPSCQAPMEVHVLQGVNGVHGGVVELDLCFACQGMWMDRHENLKLAPAAVAELFKALHAHRDAQHQPLGQRLNCPRCRTGLTQGFDVVRSGRYMTYRCTKQHGRFSTFSSFMIEKGFVRQLTVAEVDDIAKRVRVINCTSCGAPVDLRKDHACPHCRSAFSLLDPTAVEKALQGYAKATTPSGAKAPDVAEAMIALERERQRSIREHAKDTRPWVDDEFAAVDLLAVGLRLVWKLL